MGDLSSPRASLPHVPANATIVAPAIVTNILNPRIIFSSGLLNRRLGTDHQFTQIDEAHEALL